jgi:hypothetical protein
MNGMTTAKIAITVPVQLLARARRSVRKGAARSLSAYISRAMEEKAMLDDLDALLVELLAGSGGPLSPSEVRRADRALGLPPALRRAR